MQDDRTTVDTGAARVSGSADAGTAPATQAHAVPSAAAGGDTDGCPEAAPSERAAVAPEERLDPAREALRERVVAAIQTCYDPEIPVNIYELGLIYQVDVTPANEVGVLMTLTSPMCPVAETLPPEVEAKVAGVEGVTQAHVEVTWEPPWHPGLMSEAAKLELGMDLD